MSTDEENQWGDKDQNNLPLVSVVIPVYNVAPYLREALDSAIHQSYRHLEMIVVDDGSTDGSGKICDEYKTDSRVQIIHQENQGLSAARNAGLDRMTGEYVVFLDTDDAFHPDFVKQMVGVAVQERLDIVVCRYAVLRTVDRMILKGKEEKAPTINPGRYDRKEALRVMVDGQLNWSVWNKLYRAGLWKSVRFPVGHNYEDIDTTYRIMDRCESIRTLDQILYLHRNRPGSITDTHTMDNLRDRNLALEHLEAFVEAHTPEIFHKKQLEKTRQSRITGMLRQLERFGNDKNDEHELRKEIINSVESIGIESFPIRQKVACMMVRINPTLLKIAYLLYRPCRLVIKMIAGR